MKPKPLKINKHPDLECLFAERKSISYVSNESYLLYD